jgi:hypothetical protein
MSTGLQIKVPSFLIESDRCVNEGYSGTEFGYVYGDNGYLLKHPTGTCTLLRISITVKISL